MANVVNFNLNRGEDFTRTIVWKNGDGTPKDLTDATATLVVRQDYEPTNPVQLSLTSEVDGGIEIDELLGLVTFTITSDQTRDDLDTSTSFYNLRITLEDDTSKRLLEGMMTMSSEILPDPEP